MAKQKRPPVKKGQLHTCRTTEVLFPLMVWCITLHLDFLCSGLHPHCTEGNKTNKAEGPDCTLQGTQWLNSSTIEFCTIKSEAKQNNKKRQAHTYIYTYKHRTHLKT